MSKKKILFVSSEVYPFAKSGGLADVAYSLPRSLMSEYSVSVVMPLYQFVEREKFHIVRLGKHFSVTMGGVEYRIELYGCKYEGINYRFIYSPLLCDREFLYGPPHSGYEDNAIRFGIFNYAVTALLKQQHYDIAHLNDWQSALVPLLIEDENKLDLLKKVLRADFYLPFLFNFRHCSYCYLFYPCLSCHIHYLYYISMFCILIPFYNNY